MSTLCWITQRSYYAPTSKQLAIEYALRGDGGSGVCSVPCRAEQNRTARCYTAGRDDVTRQHARFQGNAGKHSDLTQQLSPGSYD
jgi:hypothetical protein